MKRTIPGLRNSGESHWQSYFERTYPLECKRILQENWKAPDCQTWIDKIEMELASEDYSELILIGHSIGCIAIVKWFEKYQHIIKGALLVAPSDSENKQYPNYITGFSPIPLKELPFKTIVVASTNDHVSSFDRSKLFASQWGSELITLQNAGHIEDQSGYTNWDYGWELVKKIEAI
ncbi:MAG: alpha/beta hydrolase [Crocinitomicaceae bacterium]|nr:alpha/beta hydrolase [Crocinitomicaceae bacterium]